MTHAANRRPTMKSAVSAINTDPAVRGEQSFAPRVVLTVCTLREG